MDAKLSPILIAPIVVNNLLKIAILVLLCSISALSIAGTVHRWTDGDGITHFSDTIPSSAALEISTLELDDDFPPVSDRVSNYYSITNQWERMKKERDTRNELSLEKERIRVERAAALADAAQPIVEPANSRYLPIYGFPRRGLQGSRFADPLFGDAHRNTRRGRHHIQPNHGRLRNSFRGPSQPNCSLGGRRAGSQRSFSGGLNVNLNLR